MVKTIFGCRFPKDKHDADFTKNIVQKQEQVKKISLYLYCNNKCTNIHSSSNCFNAFIVSYTDFSTFINCFKELTKLRKELPINQTTNETSPDASCSLEEIERAQKDHFERSLQTVRRNKIIN